MNKSEYFNKVIQIVSELHDVTEQEIISDSHVIDVVDARWIAIKLLHEKGFSSRQISTLFHKTKRCITHALQYFRIRSEDPFSSLGNNYEIARKLLRNIEETTS